MLAKKESPAQPYLLLFFFLVVLFFVAGFFVFFFAAIVFPPRNGPFEVGGTHSGMDELCGG
ncbi:MAG TPA: hypothetical protein VIW03_17415 [Anaeromyxobacter sp.]